MKPMDRIDAINKLANDIAENMELDDLVSYVRESEAQSFFQLEDEELYEEWDFRFEDEPNPFKKKGE